MVGLSSGAEGTAWILTIQPRMAHPTIYLINRYCTYNPPDCFSSLERSKSTQNLMAQTGSDRSELSDRQLAARCFKAGLSVSDELPNQNSLKSLPKILINLG
jgi:hypothetical protein